MKPLALAFAGSIASGKTTLAAGVARAENWRFASFGNFVRKQAQLRGLDPESRDVLQSIGNELIEKGWTQFCRAVLADAGWLEGEWLIIDGIRHLEGLNGLRGLVAPLPLLLVFVKVDERTRLARLAERGVRDAQAIQRMELHKTEQQVKNQLEKVADLVIDGALPFDAGIQKILAWIAGSASKFCG